MEDVAAQEKKDAADTEKDVTRMRQDAAAIEAVVAPARAVVLADIGETADGFESMGRRRRRRRKNKSSAQGSPALAVSACVTLAAAVLA